MLIGEVDREADQSLVIEMAVKIDAKNDQEKFAFSPQNQKRYKQYR